MPQKITFENQVVLFVELFEESVRTVYVPLESIKTIPEDYLNAYRDNNSYFPHTVSIEVATEFENITKKFQNPSLPLEVWGETIIRIIQ